MARRKRMHGKRRRKSSALKQTESHALDFGLGVGKKKAIKKAISTVGKKGISTSLGRAAKNILGNPYLIPIAATVEGVKFMGTDDGRKVVDTQKKSDTITEKHGGRSSSKIWSSGPKY